MIEALAAFKAAKLAKNLGLTEVEFEGDASALKDPAKNLSPYGNIISDTQKESETLQLLAC
jgi:hypothetical protein